MRSKAGGRESAEAGSSWTRTSAPAIDAYPLLPGASHHSLEPSLPSNDSRELCESAAVDTNRDPESVCRAPHPEYDGLIAVSDAMKGIVEWAARIAPTEMSVLLTGETGTGKEVMARAIHAWSRRSKQPFVAVNCGGIPDSLFEAELFGYKRGAFTGASADKVGLIEMAQRGTLLLDEIGDMPLHLQVRLLRFLEDGEVRRLGDTRSKSIDTRIIASTNRPLHQDALNGSFRLDLYFRLSVARCHIPPLRARLDDLDALVAFWLPRLCARLGRPACCQLGTGVAQLLRQHAWPGNVRELRNVLEHALCLSRDEIISRHEILQSLENQPKDISGEPCMPAEPDTDESRVLTALERHRWRRGPAAASLGISRSTLWRRLRKAQSTPER